MIISFEEYCELIDEYFDILHDWENHKVREKYYEDFIFVEKIDKLSQFNLKFAIIKGFVEYGFPFTLRDVIILPFDKINEEVIKHECWHIFFRYNESKFLKVFCKNYGIVRLEREFIRGEITNPDTNYNTGLRTEKGIIFCALFDDLIKYRVKYFVYSKGNIRQANEYEKKIYNSILNFKQNYHPEEIIAANF